MALEPLATGSQRLRKLLRDYLGGQTRADVFCRDVEVAYNDAVDQAALPPSEQCVFEALFDEVVWFNPDPVETWEYPAYKTEEQIEAAARSAAESLNRI